MEVGKYFVKGRKQIMKEILISIIIIAIIITSGTIIQNYLEKTGDALISSLQNLKEELQSSKKSENHEQSKKIVDEIIVEWEQTEQMWATIIIHQELDNIEVSLLALKAYVENEKIEEALVEVENSIFWIGHIKEKEALKLKNIF